MNRVLGKILQVFAVLLLAFAGFMLFSWWSLDSPAVPRKKLDQLHEGMTMMEVENLFGKPRSMETTPSDSTNWVYGSPHKWHYLSIQFSSDGKVSAFVHKD